MFIFRDKYDYAMKVYCYILEICDQGKSEIDQGKVREKSENLFSKIVWPPCYTQSSKLGCFCRILVKNGTQINSPIVASVVVITSLGKYVFSEEFIQGNNAIG